MTLPASIRPERGSAAAVNTAACRRRPPACRDDAQHQRRRPYRRGVRRHGPHGVRRGLRGLVVVRRTQTASPPDGAASRVAACSPRRSCVGWRRRKYALRTCSPRRSGPAPRGRRTPARARRAGPAPATLDSVVPARLDVGLSNRSMRSTWPIGSTGLAAAVELIRALAANAATRMLRRVLRRIWAPRGREGDGMAATIERSADCSCSPLTASRRADTVRALEFRILGSLKVRAAGRVVPVPAPSRAPCSRCCCCTPTPHEPDQLALALWARKRRPARPTPCRSTSRACARRWATRTRSRRPRPATGSALDPDELDALRFDRLVAEARGADRAEGPPQRWSRRWPVARARPRGPRVRAFAQTEIARLEDADRRTSYGSRRSRARRPRRGGRRARGPDRRPPVPRGPGRS